LRRRGRNLPLHPLGRFARRRPRRGVPVAGAGIHVADRLPHARRGAESRAAGGLCDRARRIPAVAEELMRNPADWVPHFRLCLMQKQAAPSVYSPPPCGEGLGVGVLQRITARPPPRRFAPTLPTRGRVGPSSLLTLHDRLWIRSYTPLSVRRGR